MAAHLYEGRRGTGVLIFRVNIKLRVSARKAEGLGAECKNSDPSLPPADLLERRAARGLITIFEAYFRRLLNRLRQI